MQKPPRAMPFKSLTMVKGRMSLCCTTFRKGGVKIQAAARDGVAILETLEYLSPEYNAILEWVAFFVFEPFEARAYVDQFYIEMKGIKDAGL